MNIIIRGIRLTSQPLLSQSYMVNGPARIIIKGKDYSFSSFQPTVFIGCTKDGDSHSKSQGYIY